MFSIGLMVVCSIYVDVLYDDMPFTVHIRSAYGTVVDSDSPNSANALINFEEFIDKYNPPHTKVVGDYSKVLVNKNECIPF